MIDRLEFASPYIYSTRGGSPISRRSRSYRDRIKGGDVRLYREFAELLRKRLDEERQFAEFFGADVTLVPVPGHAPLAQGARMVSERIAMALAQAGLGGGVNVLLSRREPVRKSAFAAPADRPRAQQHYESLEVTQPLARPLKALLVDDVVTRGATMIGCAMRLEEAFPGLEVRAFGLVRPETGGEIAAFRQPCTGVITLDEEGECWRRP